MRIAAALIVLWGLFGAAHAGTAPPLRLYTLDCGELKVGDLAWFSDAGHFDGRPGTMAVPCYLIQHPKGWMLWDAGLGDAIADAPGSTTTVGPYQLTVKKKLVDQLAQLQLKPDDIQFLALSHLHFDHTGNADLFSKATWIVSRKEIDWALQKPTPGGVYLPNLALLETVKKNEADGDLDVFGDGSVLILSTPGHTAGHRSLELKLAKAGRVVLVGDLYHLPESRKLHTVPIYNTSRAETLASMDRVEAIAKVQKARVVIQHSLDDFASMPKFPAYLE